MAARGKRGTGIQAQLASDRDKRQRARRGTRDADDAGERDVKGHRSKKATDGKLRRGPAEGKRTLFDGFAEAITNVVSSAYFFAFCLAGVVAWALFGPALGYSSTWQLVINTATTILTFLMVAVLQNSSRRGERAVQGKLDAIADALADFMDKADIELEEDVRELQEAVGLEDKVGSG